ncbi:hypothetical protein MG293_010651 [Ovis ammon polii]|uniref:G-protein coupled receptors family 1 profile domain-containing protein n=2 Tax=Ovis TaxID=9935 RepID=A0AAD4Y912_OVIAM|nr:hypothetical protein MG293_010651 [Ovis ammon polii]
MFGNLLVMTAILHFKQLHSLANFLIASLACVDFLVGVTVMPFSMVRSVESCWYFGARFCALHSSCDVAFCYSSLFHLCFISIDRYIAVTDPLVCPTKFTVSVSGRVTGFQVSNQRIMSSASPAAAVQLCYEHLNGSCVKTPYSPAPRLILYTVFSFGAVLAVFGNLLVISILHFKQLHSPANFLIASLACADFLVGVTVMPFSTVRSVESCWYFGESYCQLHSCFNGSFCYASIYHLCFISLDRSIESPWKSRRTEFFECKGQIMSSNSSPSAAVQLCYEHLNGSCVKTPYSPASRVILYMVYGFGAVLAVFGNLLVMTAILHFKQLHSPTNFLIASLACTDFLVGVTVMPFSMVRSVESCWYFGQSFCALHTCCDVAFCYSSLFHLSFISIDRYIAVTDPLVYPTKFTVSVSGICISISWILPITYSGAVFYTGANENGLEELSSALNCVGGCQTVINQNWVLVHFLSFFIPTFVMLILYSNIFLVARQQAKKIENTGSKRESSSDSYKSRVAKRERKAAKTLGITVIAFMISWLPYSIDSLIDAFMGFITPAYIYEICCWCTYYNSAMNPLIYALFYPWFRKAIKVIMVTGFQVPNWRIMSSASPAAAVQLCYEHLNGSCVKTPYSPAPRLILYTVFSFGAVLTVFGNLLVMISILHFKQLHSPTNFLIASLACADFLVGVTVMPFSTVRSVESCWYFGQRYCQLHSCFEGSFCYASIYHLCFISLDRSKCSWTGGSSIESLWKSRTEFFECKGQIMSNSSPTAAVQLCYEHLNGSCVKTPYSPASRVILYMVYGFGAVLAVFGNLLVMTAILHFKQLHSPTNFLIASLACADFLVGVTVMPFSMVRSVESCWYFGRTFCTFHTCFDTAFCYSSLFHLSFISIDRYIAVTDPLVYPTKFTVSVSGICISISWILPITYSGAVFYTGANENGLEELSSALNCVGGCQTVVNQNWVLIDFLSFFIPTLVMIILYSNIFLVARHQAKKIENTGSKTESSSDSYKSRVAKRERKAAKTLGITVIAFMISWLPYSIDSLIDAFMGFITPAYIYEICCWCAYYNSAMNPLIYALFYPWFRKAIKVIVSGRVFKNSSASMNLSSE